MEKLEKFLQNNNLHNPDDLDCLLECASLLREYIGLKNYCAVTRIISYTIENDCTDAFLWTMGILQEEFEKPDCGLEDFCCFAGSCITNYDRFVENLQVDFNSIKNSIEKVYDKNGEPEAFFNVMVYKTDFENIFLISSENFDNKDNDYINYKLSFVKNKNLYYTS